MIDVDALAQRMYDAWCREARRTKLWSGVSKTMPWGQIGAQQQQCWLAAAQAALQVTA